MRTNLDFDEASYAAKHVLDKVDIVSPLGDFHGSTPGDAPLSKCSSTNRFWRGFDEGGLHTQDSHPGLPGSKRLKATRQNDTQKTWEIVMCLYRVVSFSYDIVLVDLN